MEKVTLIAAIIAAFASIWNTWTQKRIAKEQVDADVKSKARIDWIKNVRIEAATFITECTLFEEYSSKIRPGDPTNVRVKPKHGSVEISAGQLPDCKVPSEYKDIISEEDLEEIRRDLVQSGNRLILYFGPDESGKNEKVVKHVNNIMDIVKKRKNNFKILDVRSESESLREYLRKYLKDEWNKAKMGK